MTEEKQDKEDAEETKEPAVGYVHTKDFPALLERLNISLLVTTYQAQRIMTFSPRGEKLFMLMRIFERPTGMALAENKLALASKNQIWFFEVPGEIRDAEGELLPYDVCFVPRRSHVTGDIAAHELVFHRDELYVVNTRFSCVSTLDQKWSFVPYWKPKFVSALAAEDRCHLNGLVADEKRSPLCFCACRD